MYGLSAISAANGWLITAAGITIVFTGLVVLALVLANLEKALTAWDRRHEMLEKRRRIPKAAPSPEEMAAEKPKAVPTPTTPVVDLSTEQMEVYAYFQWLANRQGETFSLPRLLEQAEKRGIRNPYTHLDLFLRLGLIQELGGTQRGFYRWNPDVVVRSAEEAEVGS